MVLEWLFSEGDKREQQWHPSGGFKGGKNGSEESPHIRMGLQILWLPHSVWIWAERCLSRYWKKGFWGPDLLHIHVSKALGEAPCVDSDPQHKAVCLTSSIKNIAIKINSGLQGIQVHRLAIYKRGIY